MVFGLDSSIKWKSNSLQADLFGRSGNFSVGLGAGMQNFTDGPNEMCHVSLCLKVGL